MLSLGKSECLSELNRLELLNVHSDCSLYLLSFSYRLIQKQRSTIANFKTYYQLVSYSYQPWDLSNTTRCTTAREGLLLCIFQFAVTSPKQTHAFKQTTQVFYRIGAGILQFHYQFLGFTSFKQNLRINFTLEHALLVLYVLCSNLREISCCLKDNSLVLPTNSSLLLKNSLSIY